MHLLANMHARVLASMLHGSAIVVSAHEQTCTSTQGVSLPREKPFQMASSLVFFLGSFSTGYCYSIHIHQKCNL